MRKIGFLAIISFLAIPFAAHATLLGTGSLDINWSAPTGGGYYLDYDGQVISSNFGYTTGLEEVFCVSDEYASSGIETYAFYTITPDLSKYGTLSQAAWIADNWVTFAAPGDDWDILKGEAQKAVWRIMGIMDITEGGGKDQEIYTAALSHAGYLTTHWYYAYSPSGEGGRDYQDYLTPTSSVPEPATLLLVGSGLIGLAGLGRKKFSKN